MEHTTERNASAKGRKEKWKDNNKAVDLQERQTEDVVTST
jgi:hypothetical protein